MKLVPDRRAVAPAAVAADVVDEAALAVVGTADAVDVEDAIDANSKNHPRIFLPLPSQS